jgi:hypothetical protein
MWMFEMFVGVIHSQWLQWTIIAAVNVASILNYLDIIPFLYSFYPMDAFEFVLRILFSDLIAFSERKGRNVPIVWWSLAFLFLPVTLFYLFFIPFDQNRQAQTQRILDAVFAATCLLYLAVPALRCLLYR